MFLRDRAESVSAERATRAPSGNSLGTLPLALFPLLGPLNLHLLLRSVLLLTLLGRDPRHDVFERVVLDLDALDRGRVNGAVRSGFEFHLVELEDVEERVAGRDSTEDGVAVVELVGAVQGEEESGGGPAVSS